MSWDIVCGLAFVLRLVSSLLQGFKMYVVKFKSSGIIAYRSTDRNQAKYWAMVNDHLDANGEPMGLYVVVKGS